ncbi:hypothetical protein D3C78_1078290 [compost metagenome]
MGMEMDRQTGRLAQRLEKNLGGSRFQQTRHVLDGDDMSAGFFKLGGKARIIFEIIFRTRRIQQIAGVADGRFAELVLLGNRIHRNAHILHPVQAVEDAEKINPAL